MRILRKFAFWCGGPAVGVAVGLILTAAGPEHARPSQPTMITPEQRAAPDLARFHGDIGATTSDSRDLAATLP
jgi:hypothetical protein